ISVRRCSYLFFSCRGSLRVLLSFPTRRSSDLACGHHDSGGATGLSVAAFIPDRARLQPGFIGRSDPRSSGCLRYGLLVVIRGGEIGRASCRERVWMAVGGVSLKGMNAADISRV